MKRIILLFVAPLLILVGCSEADSIADTGITSEYIDAAHDKLENYVPSTEFESSEIESSEASNVSDVSDISNISTESSTEEKSEAVSEDETSDTSSVPDVSIIESSDETSEESSEEEVTEKIFLINVDIAYEDETAATLVCTAEGEVDLYFGNGTEFRNMQEYEECLKRAKALFEVCEKYISSGVKVDNYPFPDQGNTYIYMKTESGVYKIAYTNTEIHLGMVGEIEICVLNTITNITKHAPQ